MLALALSCLLTSGFNFLPGRTTKWIKKWVRCTSELNHCEAKQLHLSRGRRAVESRTRSHTASCSKNTLMSELCGIFCLFSTIPWEYPMRSKTIVDKVREIDCKHFNRGGSKNWTICCCYFKLDKLWGVFWFNLLSSVPILKPLNIKWHTNMQSFW